MKISENKFLSEEVAENLHGYIRKNRLWGKRLPAQRTLCHQLRASLVTVNKGIKLLAKAGVLVCVPRQGTYVAAESDAVALPARRSKLVFVCQDAAFDPRLSHYTAPLVGPLLRMSAEKHMDALFVRLDDVTGETHFANEYPPSGVSFLVFVSTYRNVEQIKRVADAYPCPAVLVDHYEERLGITGVLDDGVSGMKQAVHHLVDLGHRRIAFIDLAKPEYNIWKRQGYVEGLQTKGIRVREDLMVNVTARKKTIDEVVRDLLGRRDAPTAFACVDDGRAMAVLSALRDMGRDVGRELGVTGYGDLAFDRGMDRSLTSVRFDREQLGRIAVEYLLGRLPDQEGKLITVETHLVVRASSGGRA